MVVLMEELQYPVGRFVKPERVEDEDRRVAIGVLAEMPNDLRNAVRGLDSAQLGTPYREGGWTVRQVVHHLADSHMNAMVRVKKALTEDWPMVSDYDEGAWARLPDAAGAPIEWSMEMIESLHARWVMLLQTLSEEQWGRGFVHPVRGRGTVEMQTLLYAWHSRHHLAHVQRLRQREGWS